MNKKPLNWQGLSLIERIHWLRLLLPPLLAIWVVTYQLGFAQALEVAYGHTVHYGVEIAFYSLAGPVVTWITLAWVERNLREKEFLTRQVQAAQQEKTAVLEEDRARIARDLHDGVAQTLYFLALKTDLLRNKQSANDEATAELREMGQTARKVIRDVRRTIYGLQPLDWSQAGFLPSVQQFIRGFAEQIGWQISIEIDADLSILQTVEPTLFRLVQESLNNIAKHADATHVWVEMSVVDDGRWFSLMVRDNGRGFAYLTSTRYGFGVSQMQSRVESFGGTFQIESQPGEGTAVSARLPLKEKRHE
jgi:signal transduction histidine kinase